MSPIDLDTLKSIEDPLGWEEDESYALRRHLGLRPIFIPSTDDERPHPDPRPCPSWCWAARTDYEHEVDWRHPMRADHYSDSVITVLQMYYGQRIAADEENGTPAGVAPATLSLSLRAHGQGGTYVHIGRMTYIDGMTSKPTPDLLKLSVEDARDLIVALTHLVGLVDADDEVTK